MKVLQIAAIISALGSASASGASGAPAIANLNHAHGACRHSCATAKRLLLGTSTTFMELTLYLSPPS